MEIQRGLNYHTERRGALYKEDGMAEFDFKCPNCGKTLRIDEAHQGKKTVCPACHKEILIPPKPAERAPQPKIVAPTAAASAMGDLLPQEEKDVLSLRPTLKMYLGRILLAVLVAAAAVALAVVIKAGPTVHRIIIITGLAIALVLFLSVLYKKYSILYRLSTQRLFLVRGLVSRKIEELELFRVRDIQVAQSFWQRILKFGRMTVFSTDASAPRFEMLGVANPLKVKDAIRVHFRTARLRERVRPTEFISDFDGSELADKDPSF
jgi:DNA-directed RNA polymerase subunit RPC12/RpoP/membrane protein YdbS with pleckstrin-like domain